MHAGILHRGKACSTVVLSGLDAEKPNSWALTPIKDLADFKNRIILALKYAETEYEDEDGWVDDLQILDEHKIEDFAHVFASTQDGQIEAQMHLKELGFTASKPVFNEKNKTVCTLFWIPMPEFLVAIGWKRK